MMDQQVTPEAQALDALLNHASSAAGAINARDAALAEQIRDLANTGLPADMHFYLQLEQKLKAEAKRRRSQRAPEWPRWLAGLAGAAVLILLVIFSIPLLQHILGQPAPAATLPAAGPAVQPSQTVTPAPPPTALPPLTATASVSEPAVSGWQIKASLPDGPQTVKAFQMAAPGEPITTESALAMAAKLSIQGTLRQYAGEGGGVVYHVSDGKSWVIFFGKTTHEFTYSAGYRASSFPQTPPSFEQMSQAAVEWLQSHSLLDFSYQVQPILTNPFGVAIVQQVEGANLYQQNAYDPAINVQFGADGQVETVLYRLVRVTEAGTTHIRPAAEAWAMLQSGKLEKGMFYQTLSFDQQRSLRTWYRAYTPGEKIDVYGYASIIQPVNPADAPYAEVASMPLTGDVRAFASQMQMRQLLHVWGIYQRDDQGRGWLDLQGWEISHGEDTSLTGIIQRSGDAVQFKDEQGQVYTLEGVPADVPENQKLSISGARLGDTLFWRIIQTGIESDINQSLGELPVPGQPLEASAQPTPELPATGYQTGDRVEGLQGALHAVIYQQLDGSQKLVTQMDVVSNGQYWTARLIGPGAQGIETHDHLPVKVWGTYQVVNNEVVLSVERYEPVWPGVTVQAYFGKINEQTLSGQTVLVVTGDAGQEWVLKMSLTHFQGLDNMGWAPGTAVVVEGYVPPDETFGGLPVLQELSLALLGYKGTTRETYKMQNAQPRVEMAPAEEENVLPGSGTVDQVALVYYSQDTSGGPQLDFTGIPLVPLWRFSGQLADGRAFEVLVPAEKP